jgi:hypothetical protein
MAPALMRQRHQTRLPQPRNGLQGFQKKKKEKQKKQKKTEKTIAF